MELQKGQKVKIGDLTANNQIELKVSVPIDNEEIDVYYLEYFDEFYRYLYLSYNPEGSDSWLLVEKY